MGRCIFILPQKYWRISLEKLLKFKTLQTHRYLQIITNMFDITCCINNKNYHFTLICALLYGSYHALFKISLYFSTALRVVQRFSDSIPHHTIQHLALWSQVEAICGNFWQLLNLFWWFNLVLKSGAVLLHLPLEWYYNCKEAFMYIFFL